MKILALDTSGKYLNIGLLEDGKLLDGIHRECFKHQSEEVLPAVNELLKKNGLVTEDIEALLVTEGPGSYTGIRIGMTVAKVWASLKKLPLYKLDSLQLVAGKGPRTAVYLDARAHRGYFGVYENGKAVEEDTILTESEFLDYIKENPDVILRGDLDLAGKSDTMEDAVQHFADLYECWEKAEPVDTLTAKYLKDSSEYLVKKS